MSNRFHFYSALGLLAGIATASASPGALEEARSTVAEWVEVEQTISREEAAWQQKERLLRDLITLSQERLAELDDTLRQAQGTISATQSARANLLQREEAINRQVERLRPVLADLEDRLRQLQRHLPPPLQEELASSFQRLPEDSATTSLGLGERMQTVIGLMEKIRQFDAGVTVHEAIRTLPDHTSPAAVRTLYLGLGQAYYLAPDDAGFGHMTLSGWEWRSQPELATAIQETMAIAEGMSNDLDFVPLPVNLATEEQQP